MSAQEYVIEIEKQKLFCLVCHLESLQIKWLQWFLTGHLLRHSIDLKGIIIHMHSSVVRCFQFNSKQGAAIFQRQRIQIKRQTNINMNFANLSIKLVKYYKNECEVRTDKSVPRVTVLAPRGSAE